MTATQYQTAIDKLGLSQTAAAVWLGLSLRTSQHYAAGTRPVPEPTAKLLRLMLRLRLKPDDVR